MEHIKPSHLVKWTQIARRRRTGVTVTLLRGIVASWLQSQTSVETQKWKYIFVTQSTEHAKALYTHVFQEQCNRLPTSDEMPTFLTLDQVNERYTRGTPNTTIIVDVDTTSKVTAVIPDYAELMVDAGYTFHCEGTDKEGDFAVFTYYDRRPSTGLHTRGKIIKVGGWVKVYKHWTLTEFVENLREDAEGMAQALEEPPYPKVTENLINWRL